MAASIDMALAFVALGIFVLTLQVAGTELVLTKAPLLITSAPQF
jgi:hypothetical protein